MFTTSIGSQGTYNIYHDKFKVKNWYKVILSQKPIDGVFYFEIYVDDFLVASVPNPYPMDPQEVKVYAGDKYHTAIIGEVKNFFHIPGKSIRLF